MHWNEKIDLLKKKYSKDEFSVPHVKRKEILRKIETTYIKRKENYYFSNNTNDSFIHWWENLDSTDHEPFLIGLDSIIEQIITPSQKCWVACEFSNHILIYNSNRLPAVDLLSIGQTWVKTFHIIESKYKFLIGLKISENQVDIKFCGDKIKVKNIKIGLQQAINKS